MVTDRMKLAYQRMVLRMNIMNARHPFMKRFYHWKYERFMRKYNRIIKKE